jgi:hypothetical protein
MHSDFGDQFLHHSFFALRHKYHFLYDLLESREEYIMAEYQHVFLSTFKSSELLFDEEETKEILKFFFTTDHNFIDALTIDDRIRNFAQGIMRKPVVAVIAYSGDKIQQFVWG